MSRDQYKSKNSDSVPNGTKVEVRNNDFGKALRRFKKIVQDEGILQEFRNKEFFEKPSIKRKREKASARSRWLKKLATSKDV